MPATDEELLRDLMHRATGDMLAPPGVAAGVVTRQRRRHRRTRVLGITATGAAAATAFGVVTATSGSPGGPTRPGHGQTGPAITLTAAQQTLNHLSAKAAAAPPPAGQLLHLDVAAGGLKKTTVVDTRNGNTWTYQPGIPGAPAHVYSPHGLPTQAQLDGYPTVTAKLRGALLAEARKEQAQALRFLIAGAKARSRGNKAYVKKIVNAEPKETSDDLVFSQAAYLLWNPALSPALRAALFKVLAATPGVMVNSHARDSIGRAAVEISRYDAQANYTEAIYEAPDASRVLATISRQPARPAQGGLPAQKASQTSDIFLSITRSNTRPAI
jgi:hypothetical protein